MKIVMLGTGTGVPVKERGCAGIYVHAGGQHILLDAGPGTARQLVKLGVTYLTLDAIFLTHFHVDHCLDFVALLFAMYIPDPARTKPLTIYGPRGLKQLYRELNHAFHGWITPRSYELTLKELGDETVKLKDVTVRAVPMHHSTDAVGYRVESKGKSVVYSGDTDYCANIVRLGRRADMLILECSMPDERKVAGHLTPSECGRIAAEADCRHLVLTHFYPVFKGYDIRSRVRRAFRGRVTLARDLSSFTL